MQPSASSLLLVVFAVLLGFLVVSASSSEPRIPFINPFLASLQLGGAGTHNNLKKERPLVPKQVRFFFFIPPFLKLLFLPYSMKVLIYFFPNLSVFLLISSIRNSNITLDAQTNPDWEPRRCLIWISLTSAQHIVLWAMIFRSLDSTPPVFSYGMIPSLASMGFVPLLFFLLLPSIFLFYYWIIFSPLWFSQSGCFYCLWSVIF